MTGENGFGQGDSPPTIFPAGDPGRGWFTAAQRVVEASDGCAQSIVPALRVPWRKRGHLGHQGVARIALSVLGSVVAGANPEALALFRVPGQRGPSAIYLERQPVLATGADLRHGECAARAVVESNQHRGEVF